MSKLFKLKKWLTLEEAATYISALLEEQVHISDLYRFSLDGYLKISVNFPKSVKVKRGELLQINDNRLSQIVGKAVSNEVSHNHIINSKNHIKYEWLLTEDKELLIDGIYDLAMVGAEVRFIEKKYYNDISDMKLKHTSIDGVYVNEGEKFYQLHVDFSDNNNINEPGSDAAQRELDNYIVRNNLSYEEKISLWDDFRKEQKKFIDSRLKSRDENRLFPSISLSQHEHLLVVTTKEIDRFIEFITDKKEEKPILTSNEKNTLLILIGALCKESKIDWNKRGATTPLVAMTELVGSPLSAETIRKILKKISPAISSRSK